MAKQSNTPILTTAPALPQAPNAWDRQFQDQYSNVLRLFFNTVDNTFKNLFDANSGGASLFKPHATFYSDVTQTALAVNTAYSVSFNGTYSGGNLAVNINGGTDISVDKNGVYSCRLTLQVDKATGSAAAVTSWVSVNGVSQPYSSQKATFAGVGDKQLTYGITLDLSTEDIITFHWSTTDTTATLQATPPTAPHPGIPAAAVSIIYASNELL